MSKRKSEKERELGREADYYAKLKVQCKNCGRKRVFPVWREKDVCDWCGRMVYKNKRIEFKENLLKELKKKRCENAG